MKKWALIAGGSSGLGLGSAKKLASEGFNLIIIHRDRRSVLPDIEKEFEKIKEHTTLLTYNFDGTSESKIIDGLDTIKEQLNGDRIHLFLHSISRGNLKPLVHKEQPALSDQDLVMTFEAMGINLLTWTRNLIEKDLFLPGARIIALTSEGSQKYWSGYAAVAIAKSSLETLVKYLAIELAPFDIRINTIQAGVTDTVSLRMIPENELLLKHTKKRNPYNRTTTPEDVANTVYLLSLPEANWINGSTIHVDAGEHLVG